VIGIDLIPAQPPRGVATFQGDFLSPVVQKLVREFIARTAKQPSKKELEGLSYIDQERHASEEAADDSLASVDVSLFD
jgi:21S rRNA (uridine2791-2'-O)-methyltransferase